MLNADCQALREQNIRSPVANVIWTKIVSGLSRLVALC